MRFIAWSLVLCSAATGTAAGQEVPPLRGTVVDRDTGAPVVGATVVIAGQAAITDEQGAYVIAAPATATVSVYYADVVVERPWVPAIPIDTTDYGIGCYVPIDPAPIDHASPALGVRVERDHLVVARGGTVDDLLAMVPAIAGLRREERIGGGLRLPGAPALSLVFADEVAIRGRGDDKAVVSSGGQVDVEPLAGGNQRETMLRASFLHDGDAGGAIAALVRGPIDKDTAWYALGADLRPGTGQLYGRVDVAASPDHQGRVIAVGTATGWPAATPSSSTIAVPRLLGDMDGRVGDLWLDALWRSKLDDARLELEAGATTETLFVAGARVTRHAARIGATRRFRARGHHQLRATAEATADDLRVDLSDRWNLYPSLTLDAGVRAERTVETTYLPHASLTWDPTAEGRSQYFVDLARRHLDPDRAAIATELTAGGQNQVGEKLVLGGAWRRAETDGIARDAVHGWALYRPWDPGLVVRAAVSGPLVADAPVTSHLEASYRLTVCIGDLIAAAGAAHVDRSTNGTFAFGWQAGDFARGLEVVIAGHTGDDPAFQLTAARAW